LPLFRAKTLASHNYFTNTEHHKNNVHSSGLLETVMTVRLLPIHQWWANCQTGV